MTVGDGERPFRSILGPTFHDPSLSIRVVSSVEGFIGAFVVALFVFAFTRQVHR